MVFVRTFAKLFLKEEAEKSDLILLDKCLKYLFDYCLSSPISDWKIKYVNKFLL